MGFSCSRHVCGVIVAYKYEQLRDDRCPRTFVELAMPARVVSHAELGESGDLAVLSAKRRTKPKYVISPADRLPVHIKWIYKP